MRGNADFAAAFFTWPADGRAVRKTNPSVNTITLAIEMIGFRMITPLDHLLSGCFRYGPYSSSSTNSAHLKSSSCAFFSWRRYRGMLIFHERVKTSGSSIVASYEITSGLVRL